MRTLNYVLAAGVASLMSTAAMAADMPIAPPPMYVPPPVEDFGGWYLRGDIGFSNQQVQKRDYYRYPSLIALDQRSSFDSAGIFGLGAGYQFNNWFRADVTGEYRGNSNFHGTDLFTYSNAGAPTTGVDTYTGNKSEWLVLANAYADLGTWWCITPFVGVGIGTARVTIANFTDTNVPAGSVAYADSASKWNFAWAVHAGVGYKISPSMTMELAYRYVDMGDGATGALTTFDGTTANEAMKFKHITSHDLKLGVRWAIDPAPVYAPPMLPPLIRKG